MKYVFDVEANDLLERATKVHCLVLKHIDTRERFSYANQFGYKPISEGIKRMEDAELLIGHNILCYDIPLLRKLLNLKLKAVLRDTLLMSRLRWPEIGVVDKASHTYSIPGALFGDYSLEAFAYRLKSPQPKVENEDWSVWTPHMQKRCEVDVDITELLWEGIQKKPIAEKALEIEHDFQEYIHVQEVTGVPFHVEKALALNKPLTEKINNIRDHLVSIVPPKKIQMKTKVKYEPFNPGSRDQIVRFLSEKYSWKPAVFTDKGNPQLSGDILESLPYPEAKQFAEFFELQKLLGMLSTGNNSWLKHVRDGRIHGRVVTVGAITRRCTHSSPNLGQIPSVDAFFGKEVRELFYATEGRRMVGADASGLELRMLSHYLARYDDGAYGREVIDGDIHTKNQLAVGLASRNPAKTFIYALLYGAGDEKLGEIFIPGGTSEQKKAAGAKARAKFKENIQAYKQLTDALQKHLRTADTIAAIDGGLLQVRSKHSALNTLLQSAGSICVKRATVMSWKRALAKGIDFQPVLHVHDEWQSLTKNEDAEEHGKIKVQAIKDAGEDLNIRIPLSGEYKIGSNWAETH